MRWLSERQLRAADRMVRKAAAERIAANPSRQALPALIRALGDSDRDVRDEVRRALDACDGNWRTSEATAKEVPRFIAALKSAQTHAEREPALKALSEIGDKRAADVLFTVLRTDPEGAHDALLGLIKMRDPRAFAEAAEGLRSDKLIVRNHAAEELIEIGDPRAVPLLIEALPATGDGVIKALTHFADPRAADALVEFVRATENRREKRDGVGRDLQRAESALRRILERSARDVPASALKPILHFEDRSYEDANLNWSALRKLARDELKRRGIS